MTEQLTSIQPFDHNDERYSFDFVIKVSERCNLACPYCYYFYQEYDGNANTAIIRKDVMAQLPIFLERSAKLLNLSRVNIVLHGGEPLLLKKSKFEDICRSIREALDGVIEVTFATQTNGVLIDEEWIDIFARHDVKVGISIDGTPELHNKLRPDLQGRGSYDAAVKGLRMVQKAVADGKLEKVGALCVVHKEDAGDKYLEHLVHTLDISSPNLNYPRGAWDDPGTLEWDTHTQNYRKMVRYWLDNLMIPKFHYVRGISEFMMTLMTDAGAERNDIKSATRHFVATISSEGALMFDDNLLGIDSSFTDKSLNIFDHSLIDLMESKKWKEMSVALQNKPLECEGCPWYRSCRSGELYNRFSKVAGFGRKSAICNTMTMIHEEVGGHLVRTGLLSLEELSERMDAPVRVTTKDVLDYLTNKDTSTAQAKSI